MACSARHVNANEPLLLAAAHNLSILRAAAQDKAATAWTLTSSLQALGPIQGGEVIGIALDQGDYPVQVGIRAPDRGAPPPSHALCGHATRRLALRRRPLLRLPPRSAPSPPPPPPAPRSTFTETARSSTRSAASAARCCLPSASRTALCSRRTLAARTTPRAYQLASRASSRPRPSCRLHAGSPRR